SRYPVITTIETVTTITVNSGATLTVNGGTVYCTGTLTDNGSVNLSSGTIHMGAPGVDPWYSISIGAGGSFTQSGGTVDVQDLSIASSPNGTYTQSAGTLNIYHDFINRGAFNATGGTVEFDGAGDQNAFPSPLGPTQFFNVTVNQDPKFANNQVSFNVAGNWMTNISVDESGKSGTVTFNGTGAQTIGGSGNMVFPNLVVNKTSGAVTLAVNTATNNGNVTVTAGTLDLSTYQLNGNAVVETLSVANGATLRIGANNFPTSYSTRSFGATSTVEYYGAAQTVSAETYGHLTLSGSSTKTMPATALTTQGNFTMSGTASATAGASMTVGGNFTIGAGTTFSAATFGHFVKGDFTNNGTYAPSSSSSFTFNGTSGQTIGGANSTTFNVVTINNSSGVTLSGVDLTVNTTLTFTAGTITTGARKVIIPAGGSVSRTSGHVVGNLQKYIGTGSPSATFEVGTSTYAPINVSFASVSVAGNLIASTTASDHPNISSSNLYAARTVNRYWTLTNSGISFTTYSATFNFVSADLDAGVTTSKLIVGRYSAGWTYPAIGTRTATSTQATGLNSFGDFQLGETAPPVVNLVKSANVSGSVLPGTDLGYTVAFTNSGASPAQNLVLTDPVPANTDFKVGSVAQSLGTTGLTVAINYSNDGGASWTYAPSSGGGGAPAGYDRNVTNIRWVFSGNLSYTSPNNSGSIGFTTRIR
ncbi:MAG TPA: hypothetical protein VE961_08365, partial [Pyrinomonadaceae bacterium]|nr:hypothetical protein [Pyrinomonadaceae bacterium]